MNRNSTFLQRSKLESSVELIRGESISQQHNVVGHLPLRFRLNPNHHLENRKDIVKNMSILNQEMWENVCFRMRLGMAALAFIYSMTVFSALRTIFEIQLVF